MLTKNSQGEWVFEFPPQHSDTTNAGREGWNDYFLKMAEVVATRATCNRAQVGAILVRDHRVLSTGYNGAPSGEEHCSDAGCKVVDGHCQRALHAEVNAVGQAAMLGIAIADSTLYIWGNNGRESPCRECRKVLIAAGVQNYVNSRGVWSMRSLAPVAAA